MRNLEDQADVPNCRSWLYAVLRDQLGSTTNNTKASRYPLTKRTNTVLY